MTAPITPDERAILRETVTLLRRILSPTRVERVYITQMPRLLDALDTAETDLDGFANAVSQWKRRALDAEAEAARLLAERTAAHADDATCASCTHEYVADMERRVEEAEAKVERQRDRLRAREEQVRRLRAEVTRLHALVADLRAATSPVRPDRETIARAIHSAHRPTTGPTPAWDAEAPAWRQTYLDFADAVLDLWPGESRATVQAEALRDAAAAAVAQDNNQGDWWDDDRQTYGTPVEWLRARADRIEKGETP